MSFSGPATRIFCTILLTLLVSLAPAWGADPAEEFLPLGLDGGEEITLTTARSPRPLSRIAENVTIITAEQIAHLNAHTLADVLQTVSGIQIDPVRTPGSWGGITINTLDFSHILVFIDGVAQNDLINNFPDVAIMPARQIERIEIVKGPSSAVWGAAMGGVVNVVTKSAAPGRIFGGEASTSYGERGTTEQNGEISGSVERLGYYLAGGNLHSKGLLPGNGINFNHAWGKLDYDLPFNGRLTVGGNFREAFRGLEESAELNFHDTDKLRYYHLFADYNQQLTEDLTLDLSGRYRRQWNQTILGSIVADPNFPDLVTTIRQATTSSTAKIRLDKAPFTAVAGFDYDHHDITLDTGEEISQNRWATYFNGSYNIALLTILPGIRYDHTALGTNPTSYILGATYQLTAKTLLRGYAANGYGLANTLVADNIQKIHTVQLGIESNDIPYLWVKGTGFYNKLSHLTNSYDPSIPPAKQTRQGVELEARTVPVGGWSLAVGYTYAHSTDDATGDVVNGVPSQSLKTAVNYGNERIGLNGALTGNYVWWNADSSLNVHYTPMVWNLHLTQKLTNSEFIATELFFSGYNLFNGSQYTSDLYKNTRRWVEGGVRFRF